jgi:hypothetical protein
MEPSGQHLWLASLPADRKIDMVLAFFATVLGGSTLLLVPQQISGESIHAIGSMRSPAFFPVLGALLMCLVALLLTIRAVKPAPARLEASETAKAGISLKRAGVMGALIFAYGGLVFVLGMVPASALFIVCAARAFGYTNHWGIGALAVVTPVLVYLLFEKLLNVLLPTGWVF